MRACGCGWPTASTSRATPSGPEGRAARRAPPRPSRTGWRRRCRWGAADRRAGRRTRRGRPSGSARRAASPRRRPARRAAPGRAAGAGRRAASARGARRGRARRFVGGRRMRGGGRQPRRFKPGPCGSRRAASASEKRKASFSSFVLFSGRANVRPGCGPGRRPSGFRRRGGTRLEWPLRPCLRASHDTAPRQFRRRPRHRLCAAPVHRPARRIWRPGRW